MNFIPRDFVGSGTVPYWHGLPHAVIDLEPSLLLNGLEVNTFRARVTVYRDGDGWDVGEMEVISARQRSKGSWVDVPQVVKQAPNGWSVLPDHFLADAILLELEKPGIAREIEETLEAEEQGQSE